MKRIKITKRTVDALQPKDKDHFHWDPELTGFGTKITPEGRKVYLLQFRTSGRLRDSDGKVVPGKWAPTKRITIGRHGAITPEQARKKAEELLSAIRLGGDPAAVRAAEKAAPTVAALAERFLAEHVVPKTKAGTAAEYRRLIENIILPALGRQKVRDVTRADVSRLHHERRDTPYDANRALAVLSKMLTLAEKWGERPDGSNPCRHVDRFAERKRERMLSADEFARLADALKASTRSPYVIAAIKLLIFTGARLGEILALQWSWINAERGEARLPDSKTGAKTLHLPPPALAVLADLPRVEGNPHVIVGNIADAHLVNLEKPWQAIRKAAGLDDLRLHDLRHHFATVGASSGMGLPIIGKLLGHTQAATTHRYAHVASDPLKAAAATVAAKIADAMRGSAASTGEVVPLRRL